MFGIYDVEICFTLLALGKMLEEPDGWLGLGVEHLHIPHGESYIRNFVPHLLNYIIDEENHFKSF